MELRELPAHGRGAVRTEAVRHRAERLGETRGRLEEDHRARLGGEVRERAAAITGLPRKEPFEREPIGRKPGHGERRDDGRRAGDRGDGDTLRNGLGDEHVPGVADRRHPGVAQHQQILVASAQGEFRGTTPLVVLVQGEELRPVRDAERLQQPLGRAGVLRRDDRRLFERRDEPRGRVAEVSDGGRGQDDHRPSIGLWP